MTAPMDYRLELIVLPVSDVERAKAFYIERLGFHLDVDHRAGEQFRVVQLTPPGSACSISIGTGLTSALPGSVRGLQIVVDDIERADAELTARGAVIDGRFHFGPSGRADGFDPARGSFASFMSLRDPDGNSWTIQEGRR